MGKVLIAAVLLFAASVPDVRADPSDLRDWYAKALAAAQSLLRPHPPGAEVIAAPQDLDRKMALVPPRDGSRMPIIAPRR